MAQVAAAAGKAKSGNVSAAPAVASVNLFFLIIDVLRVKLPQLVAYQAVGIINIIGEGSSIYLKL